MSWFAWSSAEAPPNDQTRFVSTIGHPVCHTTECTIRSANGTAQAEPGYACSPAVCKGCESRGLAGSGVDMGMRSRVKGFAKRLLGRGESTPASAPPPPRTAAPAPPAAAPAPPASAPAPKPAAPEPVEPPAAAAKPAPAPEAPVPEAAAPEAAPSETPAAEAAAESGSPAPAPEPESAASTDDAPAAEAAPKAGAVTGKKIMPENCPSCGAPSFGNWVRQDGNFGCGECGAAW